MATALQDVGHDMSAAGAEADALFRSTQTAVASAAAAAAAANKANEDAPPAGPAPLVRSATAPSVLASTAATAAVGPATPGPAAAPTAPTAFRTPLQPFALGVGGGGGGGGGSVHSLASGGSRSGAGGGDEHGGPGVEDGGVIDALAMDDDPLALVVDARSAALFHKMRRAVRPSVSYVFRASWSSCRAGASRAVVSERMH